MFSCLFLGKNYTSAWYMSCSSSLDRGACVEMMYQMDRIPDVSEMSSV